MRSQIIFWTDITVIEGRPRSLAGAAKPERSGGFLALWLALLRIFLGSYTNSLHPFSNIPTILHDGKYINDSTDIAYYLEEIFPDPPLIPQEAKDWAKCHLYEDWADESLNFYMMRLSSA